MKYPLFATLGACALTGCIDGASAPPTTTQADDSTIVDAGRRLFERSLEAAEAERSARASRDGFVDAVDAVTAGDGVYLEPGQPIVRGKDAIAALLDADDPAHARRATFDPRRITVSADGLLGATFGWNVFTTTDAAGITTTTYGNYTTMWRRQGLRWRAIAHVQNPTPVAPTPAPADFPLLDDEAPVIRLADPRSNAAEVAATDVAFAAASVAEGGAIAIPAFADADAAEAYGGPIFYGLDQVTASHAHDLPPAIGALDWAPTDAVSTFTGDLGYTDGDYTVSLASTGKVVAVGKYLTVYERQPDGSWQWILANSNPSPAP